MYSEVARGRVEPGGAPIRAALIALALLWSAFPIVLVVPVVVQAGERDLRRASVARVHPHARQLPHAVREHGAFFRALASSVVVTLARRCS
jgi:hypothetical protein